MRNKNLMWKIETHNLWVVQLQRAANQTKKVFHSPNFPSTSYFLSSYKVETSLSLSLSLLNARRAKMLAIGFSHSFRITHSFLEPTLGTLVVGCFSLNSITFTIQLIMSTTNYPHEKQKSNVKDRNPQFISSTFAS